MRRVKIFFYWLFKNKNNVSINEMLYFLSKPKINRLAQNYIKELVSEDDIEVTFKFFKDKLYWPKKFNLERLNQVVCENFDNKDFHYYQGHNTPIEQGEILLDIGTAEGLFPLSVINKCNKIFLVEPSVTFANCLKKTFANYSDKVVLINKAVGNDTQNIFFDENSLDGIISKESNNTIAVELDKIDNIIKNEKITYLKADIEGFELEMLKGAANTIKQNKPKIAITTYHDANNPQQIIDLIKSYVPEYNFFIKGIDERKFKPVLVHFWI